MTIKEKSKTFIASETFTSNLRNRKSENLAIAQKKKKKIELLFSIFPLSLRFKTLYSSLVNELEKSLEIYIAFSLYINRSGDYYKDSPLLQITCVCVPM